MRKLFLILMTLMAYVLGAQAQNRTYHGQVVDAESNEPLAGATVMPIGGGKGVATDFDGKFTLTVPQSVTTAKVTYVGYKEASVKLTNNMVVKLSTSSETLDDLMVVAFGTTTKEAFTGAAAVVNAKDLQKHTTTNVANALVGSVPGLQMRGAGGGPGGTGSINIRGISSLYSGVSPLIIVDGAPYGASLATIPQDDIASISVLKDAASAALYGARGAAGVIIITTKKGSSRDAVVRVDARWGSNTRAVQDYDVITNPAEYYEAFYAQNYNYQFYSKGLSASAANNVANSAVINKLLYNVYTLPEGETMIGMDGKLNPNATLGRKVTMNGEDLWLQPDNWTDEAYKTGMRQEYTVSVNGGTDRSNFYTSMNYLKDEGIINPSNMDRFNGRMRAEYQAKKWLKVGGNAAYTHYKYVGNSGLGTSFSSGNIMYFTGMIAPIFPVYVRGIGADGKPYIKTDENGLPMYDYGQQTYYQGMRPFGAPGNPIGLERLNKSFSVVDMLNATVNATVDFTSYLKLDVNSNAYWSESRGTGFGSPFTPGSSATNGSVSKSVTTNQRWNNSQTLTFHKLFGNHNVNVMAGHEYYHSYSNYLYAEGQGVFSPDILELDATANVKVNASSNSSNYNVEGWFGSANYDFENKYYVSASYRRDASSRFAVGHRWGNFWSVGGAWMMSKENFMASTKGWLDLLKLKVSVGQQGNDNLSSSYAWTDMYSLERADERTMNPKFTMGFGNPDITWETTTNTNVGFEFGLFKGWLTGNVDFYNKYTNNLLFWLSVPESTGGRGYYGNMGSIRNTGVELSLTSFILRDKDYDWSVSGNISYNQNRILKLPYDKIKNLGGFYEGGNWYNEGGTMYNPMTLAFAGLTDQGEVLYYYDPELKGNTSKPGQLKDPKYTTTIASEASRYEVGCILPVVYGGLSTSARYKWIDVTATFDYSVGGKVYDSRYASLMSPDATLTNASAGRNFHKDWVNSWNPVTNPNSEIPRWQIGDENGTMSSDRYYASASYFNFQSFAVGVTLPQFVKELSKVRFYCMGENLCFWSARKGLDPRYSYSGNTSVGSYSPMRTISGGVEVVF